MTALLSLLPINLLQNLFLMLKKIASHEQKELAK